MFQFRHRLGNAALLRAGNENAGAAARVMQGAIDRAIAQGADNLRIEFLRREEWARTAEDVLWRRTKCGLHMSEAERAAFSQYMAGRG